MLKLSNLFRVVIKGVTCLSCVKEDELQDFVENLAIEPSEAAENVHIVTASVPTHLNVDSAGIGSLNVSVDNRTKNLLGKGLIICLGAPSATNPGPGREYASLADLTRTALNQPANEQDWQVFFARDEPLTNNFTSE